MITRNIFSDIIFISVLAVFQVVVLSRVNILGEYTPVMYPMFVMFYPFFRNKYIFLLLSFLLGFVIDANIGTWGVNAFATTLIAYFRTIIFRTSTDSDTDFFSFQSIQWSQFIFFILMSVFLHQFIVQFLEYFKLSRAVDILINVCITSIISFFFILVYAIAFRIKEKV
ncbi:rod shape-determining protein MreD [Bergeyella cardium]|uniref:Rod shape-determining protein MreD n=1 Tax=Bergeyella cardium TaxID=1585976 RepID=A0A6P1QT49_9FLAO|nr:rod shape-determining protein MreD [Bergeyella cardium]QHN65292.1 rod shape-determining protein MreD [Bergeyella cardium]WHE32868.1 rod shape-determining protein MreD [Bergeyella cardium]WHF59521.1 rod shape-determining protein MreD [Bergeyella cardium]